MKVLITILLELLFNHAIAQQLNGSYRTVADVNHKLHYRVFGDRSICKVIFPALNHGDAMFRQNRDFELRYEIKRYTIYFYRLKDGLVSSIAERFIKSRFTLTEDKKLFDHVTGYTYVDKRLISD